MNTNEMDPHVSYLAFDGDTPMRILKDGELGDEYRIERKWRNKDTFDYPVASGKTTLSMPQAAEHIVKYQMAAAGAL